jgi:hypothetical protein
LGPGGARELRVEDLTLPGKRDCISSAMRLLKATERMGRELGRALKINVNVEVLAAPARAEMRMLS